MIRYIMVQYRFDASLWAAFVNQACKKHSMSDIAEMIDVDVVTIKAWIKEEYKPRFKHPSMNKFLNLCNLMDVDPGQFFTIQDA